MVYLLAASAALFVLFWIVYKTDKTRSLCGFLFLCFLLCAGITYGLWAVSAPWEWLSWTVLVPLGLLGVLLVFGVYILVALLFWNARSVLRRERRSLSNSLTLALGLLLVLLLAAGFVLRRLAVPLWVRAVWYGGMAVLLLYFCILANFLVSLLLANLARPPKKQEYIIVLGSGLVGGEVPPLLAARIDRAVRFYDKQKKKRRPPRLVMSGGQGPDEPVSEAAAMAEYAAVVRGVPREDILLEERSTSTAENFRFSRQLLDFTQPAMDYRCIYATSNYHLLRAGRLARQAGLAIDGLGSRVAPYYLPNALLREFMATVWMHRLRNLALAGGLFTLVAGATLLFPERLYPLFL